MENKSEERKKEKEEIKKEKEEIKKEKEERKIKRQFLKEQFKKARNKRRAEYCSKRPEIKEHKKEYDKEYLQRPEVKERIKERMKEYFERSEIKERTKEYNKEYNQKPEIKERKKKKYLFNKIKKKMSLNNILNPEKTLDLQGSGKPEIKERINEYLQKHKSLEYQKPSKEYKQKKTHKSLEEKEEIKKEKEERKKKREFLKEQFKKARNKRLAERPEIKERQKEYLQRPEIKERIKERMKEYFQRPDVKEYKRKQYLFNKIKKKMSLNNILNQEDASVLDNKEENLNSAKNLLKQQGSGKDFKCKKCYYKTKDPVHLIKHTKKYHLNQKGSGKFNKKEYMKEYNKKYNQLSEVKEYQKEYHQRPEIKKHKNEYIKEYNQRPEIKKYKNKYMKEYLKEYRNKKNSFARIKKQMSLNSILNQEENDKKNLLSLKGSGKFNKKEYMKEYNKKYQKEYHQRPEIKKHKKEYRKEYDQRPEIKKYKDKYMKEYLKEYRNKKNSFARIKKQMSLNNILNHGHGHGNSNGDGNDSEESVAKFLLSLKGSGTKQFYGKKSKIMVKVPENVKKTALYAFKLKKLGFQGGKETGWKRAKQLATKEYIPIEDLKYMRAWFARHVYSSYPTFLEWKKAGRQKDSKWHKVHGIIAILIWGGEAALKWVNSNKNINLLNKHFNKNYTKIKT